MGKDYEDSEIIRIPSAPGVSYYETDAGNGHLASEIHGCPETELRARLKPANDSGQDYILEINDVLPINCYITSMDAYFIDSNFHRIHPLVEHEDGNFIPFVINKIQGKVDASKIHFDIKPNPHCTPGEVSAIELVINRYLQIHAWIEPDVNICLTQTQGRKTMSNFSLVPFP